MVNQCQQSSRLWIWQICSFFDVLSWGDNFYPGGISSPGTCNAETDKTDAATRISLGSSSCLSRTKHNHTGSTFKVIDFLDLRVQFWRVESWRDVKSKVSDIGLSGCFLCFDTEAGGIVFTNIFEKVYQAMYCNRHRCKLDWWDWKPWKVRFFTQ